jgi:outer membrane protein insertion porin family
MAASRKIFLRFFEPCVVVCLVGLALIDPLWGQQPRSPGQQFVITKILFEGNRRIQRDTLLARIFSRVGDPYNEDAIRRDFQALWNTQFFEDIRLEVEDDPEVANGKILVFYVTERPIIRRIEYKGNKSITESDILDAFKDKKVGLSVESQFDPTKIKRAEVVIKQLLAEHGRQFATVKPTYERIPASNAVKLVFNIDEGPKVKVGTITIAGNKAFSDRKIIRSMRHDRPYSIPLYITYIPVLSKTFDRKKLDEDMEVGIRGLYQDHGYFKVSADVSSLNTVDVDRGGIPGPWPGIGAKHGKATDITIKIEEGEQYRMGSLQFRSGDPDQGLVFKTDILARAFPLKQGDIFAADKIRKALDNYKKLYGEFGYIDFVATPLTDVDDKKKLINLTMEFNQQKQFFVRRIEFAGNTTTRDKVIRRELLIDEGQIFNNRLWELSILRLNQLNYFDKITPDNAELKRNVKAGTVDIKLKVKEKGKQSISFSGGVSGIAGSFIGLTYQTNNFLGLGETLTIGGQIGQLQTNVSFGFTEPYLFDRPISTGFNIFASKFNYNSAKQFGLLLNQEVALNPALQENYTTDTKGFTVFASYPLRRYSFTRLGLTYGFSETNISTFSTSAQLLFEILQFRGLAGPSALRGIRESKVTPTITKDTRDNPLNPTRGRSFSFASSFEGGPLQGNVNAITNTFSMTYFHAHTKHRNVIGFHLQAATTTGYGGKDVVPYNRFYLGGENDVRGFDFYTISPFVNIPELTTVNVTYQDPRFLGSSGQPLQLTLPVSVLQFVPTRPGGDTQLVQNFEYRIPIAGPVGVSLFNDIGTSGVLYKNQLASDPGNVLQIQQEFPNAQFPNVNIGNHLPIISGTNFRPHTSAGIQFEVVLPIVNAPFRFYWAYNYVRLNPTGGEINAQPCVPTEIEGNTVINNSTAFPPCPAYFLPDSTKQALGSIFQTQIAPQLNNVLLPLAERIPASLLEPKSTFRFTVGKTF